MTISMFNDIQLKDEYRSLVEAIDNLHVQHAVGLLTNYLAETQKQKMEHLTPVVLLDEEDSLQMDFSTRQNLELTQTLRTSSKSETLWSFMDHCQTAMGSRMLRRWIEYPLVDQAKIEQREDAIDYLNSNCIPVSYTHLDVYKRQC